MRCSSRPVPTRNATACTAVSIRRRSNGEKRGAPPTHACPAPGRRRLRRFGLARLVLRPECGELEVLELALFLQLELLFGVQRRESFLLELALLVLLLQKFLLPLLFELLAARRLVDRKRESARSCRFAALAAQLD